MSRKKLKTESACKRNLKHKPYGATGTSPWCTAHDCHSTYTVNKKSVRAKAKREIRKELAEVSSAPLKGE